MSVKRIYNPIDLEQLAQDLQRDAILATSVQDLTIAIEGPFSVATLRHCLSLTTHLSDLFLHLPADSPVDMLNGLHLERLEFLETSLPHRHLRDFIAVNTTLGELSLAACQRDKGESCPLQDLHYRPYLSVECSGDCALGVVHPRLYRLTMHQLQGVLTSAPAILRTLRPPLITLSRLVLDFSSTDYDILESIVPVAPRLEKLKLLEKARPTRRPGSARRAWNLSTMWASNLRKLAFLEEFALRTAATLVPSPASVDREKKTLLKWVTPVPRKGRAPMRASEHPALLCIRLWYRSQEPDHGIVTVWSKNSGTWKNIYRCEAPSADTLF